MHLFVARDTLDPSHHGLSVSPAAGTVPAMPDPSPFPPTAPPPRPVASGLYLVATPIGNLRDITLRALDVLNACDVLLAEDTRVSGKLLAAYQISKRLERYDEHVADRVTPRILERLAAGERVAMVSDAGTPMISDPGFRLAREAIAAGHQVFPIPGASAALAALPWPACPPTASCSQAFPRPRAPPARPSSKNWPRCAPP